MTGDAESPLTHPPRVGLALASGAPEGAIYEIAALRALDEAVEGLDLNRLHVYVGVSAGAFLTACLANDLTTAQMCRAIVSTEPGEHPFVPETFLTPAVGVLAKSFARVPGILWEGLRDYVCAPGEHTLTEVLTRLSRALPVGVFDNEPIRAYLEKIFTMKGRSDDFRRLGKHLIVVAADLDSGQAVRLGDPPFDAVPISRAVQASSALPGLYPPVEIDGRHYVDGVLLKTLHASVALEAGAELLFCINPLVPVDTARAVEAGLMRRGNLVERGLPTVLAQTFRTVVHSRMAAGMAAYRTRFEHADVVLLQPRRDDYTMFFTNIFGFAERRSVAEHAYRATRRDLLARYDELAPVLARHGLTLSRDVLEDAARDLWRSVGLEQEPGGRKARREGRRRARRPAAVSRLDEALAHLDRVLEGHAP